MRVGLLCLQGAFREHLGVFDSLGVSSHKVTKPEHLTDLDSIIPGSESSAMVRIAAGTGLFRALSEPTGSRMIRWTGSTASVASTSLSPAMPTAGNANRSSH